MQTVKAVIALGKMAAGTLEAVVRWSAATWIVTATAAAAAAAAPGGVVLTHGHLDVGIAYENGAWDLHVHREEPAPGEEFDPGVALIQVGAAAALTGGVPATAAATGFFGPAGSPLWVLPNTEQEGLPFLGIGAEEMNAADWIGNLTLSLAAVNGPGNVFVWDVGALGELIPKMSSRDGIGRADALGVAAGSHAHFFWGFSSPGEYEVFLAASGVHAVDGPVSSLPVGYRFQVRPESVPVRLTDGHVDVRIRYDAAGPGTLDVVVADDDFQPTRFLDSADCLLVVEESARLELPSDIPPLGSAGDPLWVLPASQRDGLLYLGVSGEGAPDGVFAEPFRLRLVAVEGPGHFFLWQAELGGLEFRMNSRDGIGPDDVFTQPVGGHNHANWGFTAPGVYRVTLLAEGRRTGETTNVVSPPRTFTFHVLPLPGEPETPFRRWQKLHWPGVSDPAVVGETADPDGDGLVNLWEHVLATDPTIPNQPVVRVPMIALEAGNAGVRAVVRTRRDAKATDAVFTLWTANRIDGPWTLLEVGPVTSAPTDGWVDMAFTDPRPVVSRAETYYRLAIGLGAQP